MFLGGIVAGIGFGLSIADTLVPDVSRQEFHKWFHGWFMTFSVTSMFVGAYITGFAWRHRNKTTL